MSGHDNGEQKDVTAQASPAKKPYVAPTLRRLGSVRELTLGLSSGGTFEDGTKVKAGAH